MSEWRVVVAAAEGCELGSMCEGTNYNFWKMVDGKLEWMLNRVNGGYHLSIKTVLSLTF